MFAVFNNPGIGDEQSDNMAEAKSVPKSKMLIIGTHSYDDIEKAMLVFMASTAALAIGIEVNIFLVAKGTNLARKNYVETMPRMHGMESLATLMQNHLEMGGGIQVCIPCKEFRGVKNSQYIAEAKFLNMMDMAEMVQAHDKVLVF
jgi:predicted peroxiredoxin